MSTQIGTPSPSRLTKCFDSDCCNKCSCDSFAGCALITIAIVSLVLGVAALCGIFVFFYHNPEEAQKAQANFFTSAGFFFTIGFIAFLIEALRRNMKGDNKMDLLKLGIRHDIGDLKRDIVDVEKGIDKKFRDFEKGIDKKLDTVISAISKNGKLDTVITTVSESGNGH